MWLLTAVAVLVSGCSKPGSPSGPSGQGTSSTLAFTASPITTSAIEFVTALGQVNPPDHTLPTDHIYFYHRLNHPNAPVYDVVAPAGGTVSAILKGNDDKIYVSVTSSQTYYLGHVILDSSIRQGTQVAAGQRLGVTSTLSYGLDLGLVNRSVTQGFINAARYNDDSLHADAPLKYFDEPLRSTLYGLVTRTGPDKDGEINFDRAGRLSGNWFLDGLPVSSSTTFGSGPMQISFARDARTPANIIVAIGGTLSMTGMFGLGAGSPDPADVSAASGLVELPLIAQAFGAASGVMLVQFIDANTVRIETFPGATSGTAGFTGAAKIYRR
ncbi:MAG TPA: hypothetical protein VN700_05305 [Vicinamibacterales bacterium]|nr:hypothetical protein [Vicinamibacterales bacterium]